jgi:formylglycine-generating enzyme required for sulfatase activity
MTGTECQAESCCTSLPIPEQSFLLGQNVEASTSVATVAAFTLDKYEVTVSRFQRFVAAYDAWRGAGNPVSGAGAHSLIASSGWQGGWPLPASASELTRGVQCEGPYRTWGASNQQLPMNCVNWFVAFAFCAWDGQRLPTEAEWEDAAAGGDQSRTYPWGSTPAPDVNHAVFNDGDILSVGSKPRGAGRWGHLDLAGSTWEWALDWYNTYPTSCTNCASVTSGSLRVMRGGSWVYTASDLRAANRGSMYPSFLDNSIGFRCARSAP